MLNALRNLLRRQSAEPLPPPIIAPLAEDLTNPPLSHLPAPLKSSPTATPQKPPTEPPHLPLAAKENTQSSEDRSHHAYQAMQTLNDQPEDNPHYRPFGKKTLEMHLVMDLITDPDKANEQLKQTAKDLVNLVDNETKQLKIKVGQYYELVLETEFFKNLQEIEKDTLKGKRALIANLEDKRNVFPAYMYLISLFALAYDVFLPIGSVGLSRRISANSPSCLGIHYYHYRGSERNFIPLGPDLDMSLRNKLYTKLKTENTLPASVLDKILAEYEVEKYLHLSNILFLRRIEIKIKDLKTSQNHPEEFAKIINEIKQDLKEIKPTYEQIIMHCESADNYPEYLDVLKNPDFAKHLEKFKASIHSLETKELKKEEPKPNSFEEKFSKKMAEIELEKFGRYSSPKPYALDLSILKEYFSHFSEETVKDTIINWPLRGRLKDKQVGSFSKTLIHLIERTSRAAALEDAATSASTITRPQEPPATTTTDNVLTTLEKLTTDLAFNEQELSSELKELLNEFKYILANIKSLREQVTPKQNSINHEEKDRTSDMPLAPRDPLLPLEQEYQRTLSENSKFVNRLKQAQKDDVELDDILNKLQTELTKLTNLQIKIQEAKLKAEPPAPWQLPEKPVNPNTN